MLASWHDLVPAAQHDPRLRRHRECFRLQELHDFTAWPASMPMIWGLCFRSDALRLPLLPCPMA